MMHRRSLAIETLNATLVVPKIGLGKTVALCFTWQGGICEEERKKPLRLLANAVMRTIT
jgi:hypothetical protein